MEANPFRTRRRLQPELVRVPAGAPLERGIRGLEFIEVEARSALNHVAGDRLPFRWTVNPYRGCSHACVYCFARGTHRYLDMNPGEDFERRIVVKTNVAGVLRAQLSRRSWRGELVALGTNTDPYQAAEGRYRLMPGILRALIDHRNPFSILTKGTLILRDLELLLEANRCTSVTTAFSVGTVDDAVWRRTEPGTPRPRSRLAAVRRINQAGITCGVLMAPILPGISDSPEQLKRTADAIAKSGAAYVHPILLHLRPGAREVFLAWLEREMPELLTRYSRLFAGGPYLGAADREELEAPVRAAVGPCDRGPGRVAPPKRGPQHAEQMSLLTPAATDRPQTHQLSV